MYELKDYLNSINQGKNNLMDGDDPLWEKKYPAYIVNKCMTGFIDTLFFANEMNRWNALSNKMQYDFYLHGVPKKKRFAPYMSKTKIENLELIKRHYDYSNKKAEQALKILTDEQVQAIRGEYYEGGRKDDRPRI